MAFMRQASVLCSGKSIAGLKIEFEVVKVLGEELNNASISIFNLSQETFNTISVPNSDIQLQVGYQDEINSTIFFGNVVRATRERSGTEIITKIEAKDGRVAMFDSYISVSYSAGTATSVVVSDLLSAIGLASKGQELLQGFSFENGFSDTGLATAILKKVLKRVSLDFTIQNAMLYIHAQHAPSEITGLLLNARTGLLTLPTQLKDNTASDIDETAPNKWQFRTLIFAELIPNASCIVESTTLTGQVLITKITYKGSNWDGDFICDIEAEAL